MSKKKKKTMKQKLQQILDSRFYRIYFAVVAVVLVAMIIGRIWLNGVLKDYEAAQPVYVAEKVANLFETGDYETIYQLDTSAENVSQGDPALYLERMGDLTQGKEIAWSKAYSSDETKQQNYSVTMDGERFATFSLVPSGETTGHGNRMWRLGNVSTLVQVEATPEPTPEPEATPVPVQRNGMECRIKVPNGYSVTVDGEVLDKYNSNISTKPLVADGFLPNGIASLTYTEYLHTANTQAPVVEVKDSSGAVQQLTQNNNTWTCPVPGDAQLEQQYSNAVFALAKRIAKITARDASVESMYKYCASKSPARLIFENYSNRWATPHSKTAFTNEKITEFYQHSDNCFTCHISFDFLMKTSKGTQTYPTSYTFCIVKQGSSGKLYNLMMQ